MAATNVHTFQSRVDRRGLMQAIDQQMIDCVTQVGDSPAQHAAIEHLHTGGSRMRARLAVASASISLNQTDAIFAAAACELLHNASLVHDDIADGDELRRNAPTVAKTYGSDIAVCAGDLLLSAAFAATAAVSDHTISRALTTAMAQMAARVIGGQSTELAQIQQQGQPARRDYLNATRDKTAPLIELALIVGLFNDTPAERAERTRARVVAEALGLAYQIIDDLDDLQTDARLHPLHAWWHHQPIGGAGDLAAVRARCLRHAQAALKRAQAQSQALPAALRDGIGEVITTLSHKADG